MKRSTHLKIVLMIVILFFSQLAQAAGPGPFWRQWFGSSRQLPEVPREPSVFSSGDFQGEPPAIHCATNRSVETCLNDICLLTKYCGDNEYCFSPAKDTSGQLKVATCVVADYVDILGCSGTTYLKKQIYNEKYGLTFEIASLCPADKPVCQDGQCVAVTLNGPACDNSDDHKMSYAILLANRSQINAAAQEKKTLKEIAATLTPVGSLASVQKALGILTVGDAIMNGNKTDECKSSDIIIEYSCNKDEQPQGIALSCKIFGDASACEDKDDSGKKIPAVCKGSGDKDLDGILDAPDNCPEDKNPGQEDADKDGVGDACDNCPTLSNIEQDANACPDSDGDGTMDSQDNCPDKSNFDQKDTDYDGVGDVCDNCPMVPNPDQNPDVCAGIKQIDVGLKHSCVLFNAGNVKCWGSNSQGQLGVGDFGGESLTPVPVKNILTAVAISAGGDGTCAILKGGGVNCWGTIGFKPTSSSPVLVGNISNAVAIDVGRDYACVILEGGSVKCWGMNDDGQLGNGIVGGWENSPVSVENISNAIAIKVGLRNSCVILEGGDVNCWGSNGVCLLGNKYKAPGNFPSPVPVLNLAKAKSLGVSWNHICALLESGKVKCWGHVYNGELGKDTDEHTTSIPLQVPNISTAEAMAVAYSSGCAVLKDGKVKCWGLTPQVKTISDVVAIDADYFHYCALLKDNSVWCWGGNEWGQLGNGNKIKSSAPVKVKF